MTRVCFPQRLKTLDEEPPDPLECLGEEKSENKKGTKNKKRIGKSTDIYMLGIRSDKICCGNDQKNQDEFSFMKESRENLSIYINKLL